MKYTAHTHELEFESEEDGVSKWRCLKPNTWRDGYGAPIYTGLCHHVELQFEDCQL